METLLTLVIFTVSYGLLFLSFFPKSWIKNFNGFKDPSKKAFNKLFELTWPFFLSFLGGYALASLMVYFIKDWI